MEGLNDDCLILVFHHLPLFSRVKCEGVSKKWRDLMPYNDIKTLNLTKDIPWPEKEKYIAQSPLNLTTDEQTISFEQPIVVQSVLQRVLNSLLTRCGNSLKELFFEQMPYEACLYFDIETFHLIASLCPKLTNFHAPFTIFQEACIPLFVEAWPKLESLDLPSAMFIEEQDGVLLAKGEVIQEDFENFLTSHPCLEVMNFPDIKFTPQFQNYVGLKVLNLYSFPMNDEKLVELTLFCPNLVSLNLDMCEQIHDFCPLVRLVNIEKLSVSFTNFDNDDLKEICENCPKISNLALDHCTHLNCLDPLQFLKNLSGLHVAWLDCFDDEILRKIIVRGKLQDLEACACNNITSTGVQYLGTFCPNLIQLNLNTTSVSDEDVLYVIEKCQKLKFLGLAGTQVSKRTTNAVVSSMGSLETLRVDDCPNIDEVAFEEFYKLRKDRVANENLPELMIVISWDGELSSDLIEKLEKFCKVKMEILRAPGTGAGDNLEE